MNNYYPKEAYQNLSTSNEENNNTSKPFDMSKIMAMMNGQNNFSMDNMMSMFSSKNPQLTALLSMMKNLPKKNTVIEHKPASIISKDDYIDVEDYYKNKND